MDDVPDVAFVPPAQGEAGIWAFPEGGPVLLQALISAKAEHVHPRDCFSVHPVDEPEDVVEEEKFRLVDDAAFARWGTSMRISSSSRTCRCSGPISTSIRRRKRLDARSK